MEQPTQAQQQASIRTTEERVRRVKQKAQSFQHTDHEEPARKKQRTDEQAPQAKTEILVNPNDARRIQKGKTSVTNVREATGFSDIPLAAD